MKKGLKVLFFVIIISSLLLITGCTTISSLNRTSVEIDPKENMKSITLVTIDGLSFIDLEHIDEYPNLAHMAKDGLIGGMNLNTAGGRNSVNNYMTIGTGTRAVGYDNSGESYRADENVGNGNLAKDLYQQRTGIKIEGNPIVLTALPQLISANSTQKYQIQIGALGEELKKAGKTSAVLGNADHAFEKAVRYAPLITMDKDGVTPLGDVSPKTWNDNPARPYGIETNYDYLFTQWNGLREKASLIVVDLGDLSRLQDESKMFMPERVSALHRDILSEMDAYIGKLMDDLKKDEMLIVVGPMVGPEAVKSKSLLAPIIMMDGSGAKTGVISSLTTKREGIIANIDVAPSILGWLGLTVPEWMLGKKLTYYPEERSWSRFQQVLKQTNTTFQQRPPVLYAYVTYQVTVLIVAIAFILKGWKLGFRWLKYMLYTIMLTPFLFLFTSPFIFPSPYVHATLLWLIAFILSVLLERLKLMPAFFIIGLVSWVPVILDGLVGGPLIKRSVMGYDPIIGARYYGIGNEYMGIVIGALILSMSALMVWKFPKSKWMISITALIFLAVTVFFAAPFWGTNAGGALAAAFGFAVAYLRYSSFTFSAKHLIRLFLIFIGGIAVLFLFNMFTSGAEETHIGRAMDALFSGNFTEIADIIARKLEMNWKLIQVSAWSKVFVTALIVMGVLIIRPTGEMKKVMDRYPAQLMAGFTGIVAGAIMALLVNDSGIVAAATMIIYVVIPMLVLRIDELQNNKSTIVS